MLNVSIIFIFSEHLENVVVSKIEVIEHLLSAQEMVKEMVMEIDAQTVLAVLVPNTVTANSCL